MAPWLFTEAILNGKPINVFNKGKMQRDFTYIHDIVDGMLRVLDKPAKPNPELDLIDSDPSSSFAPYRMYNIGNHQPEALLTFIETIENKLGREADKNHLSMQAGDVPTTFADMREMREEFGFYPSTALKEGMSKFIDRYISYHKQPKF